MLEPEVYLPVLLIRVELFISSLCFVHTLKVSFLFSINSAFNSLKFIAIFQGSKEDLNNSSHALLALGEINRCYAENTIPFFLGLVGYVQSIPEIHRVFHIS